MRSTLAIDTTQPEIHVALLTDGKILAEYSARDGMIVENLLSLVELILSENKLKIEAINRIVICNGPGSYTGIRSGLSTVFGFQKGSSSNLELISVNSIFARSVKTFSDSQIVLGHLSANKTEDYVAGYRLIKSANIFKSDSEICIDNDLLKFEEVLAPVAVNKEGLVSLKDQLENSLNAQVKIFDCAEILDNKVGNIAGSLGWASFCNSRAVVVGKIEPLYVKGVQAMTLLDRGVRVDTPI
jgi:tRNA threonylcarbamoyladenosine biosynthesis protein TsaB